MNTHRRIGIILSIAGFALAVVAGLILAVRLANEQIDTKGVLGGAGLAFIPVALLTGAGIYLYVKSEPDEVEPISSARKQRELLDLLRSRGQITWAEAARELEMSAEQIRELVDDLIQLQIFPGHVDWEKGILYAADSGKLLDAP